MKLDKQTSKRILLLVAISLGMVWLMLRLELLPSFISSFFNFFSPVWIGIAIAFIVNMPMRFFERKLFGKPWKKRDNIRLKIKRPVSLIIAFLVILGVLTGIVFLVVPDLTNTIVSFTQQLPGTIRDLQAWVEEQTISNPTLHDFLAGSNITINDLIQRFINWLNNTMSDIASQAFSWITSVVSSFMNFFFGLVFALYFLGQKEKLVSQVKKLAYAALPERFVDRLLQLGKLVNTVFSRFIGGQGLEALILGSLVFIGMQIFRFPYPLTISVLVIIGALIPVFGAFIAGLLGAILISVESPIQAIWFIIMLVIIQQIEGNFIYPRVVGKSVGLPSVWVLFAVTFGSKLFGFMGLLLGVPGMSVLYVLLRAWSSAKVKDKDIDPDKLSFAGEADDETPAPAETPPGEPLAESQAEADQVFQEDEPQRRRPEDRVDPNAYEYEEADENADTYENENTYENADTYEEEPTTSNPKIRRFKVNFDLDKVEQELNEEEEEARRIRESHQKRRD